MATTSIPCPACFQAQTVHHQNGEEVNARLCAACAEEADHLGLDTEGYARKARELQARRAQAAQG